MKKLLVLALSVIIMSATLIASCAGAAQSASPTVALPRTTASSPSVPTSAAAGVPKYGSVLTHVLAADIVGFDEGFTPHYSNYAGDLTNDNLLTGDWAKGPAGTNEIAWTADGAMLFKWEAGSLAESWEIPEAGHMIFHIRHGVHFALNSNSEASRLANGRELTADDVVFTLKRYTTLPTAYIRLSYATMATTVNITAPDKWTVDIRAPRSQHLLMAWQLPDFAVILAPEVVQKYGDVRDWHNSVGTGAFILTDYVSGSQLTFVRNPNCWAKDPVGPGKGNQLPYVDGVKMLIIPDPSTRLAAFRAGRIDSIGNLIQDDAAEFLKNPQVKYTTFQATGKFGIYMRIDKPDLPFKDKRVRQALMMAVDFQAINKQLFAGTADINSFPISRQPGYEKAYLPLQEASDAAKQLYSFQPDKARQLLADAGYPGGFKTTVITSNAPANVDFLQVVKAMWAKVGVDMTIDQRDPGVFNAVASNKSHDQMIYAQIPGIIGAMKGIHFNGATFQNESFINDPYVVDMLAKQFDAYAAGDEDKYLALYKEMTKYVLEQAWCIPTPAATPYNLWWPWLKNYHGENAVGFNDYYGWSKYVWIDSQLKQSMGH